jgi:hypothetical protein
MTIKLTFNTDRTKVEISEGRRTLDVVERRGRLSPEVENRDVLAFSDRTPDYAYDYEFTASGGYAGLHNRRVDLSAGRVFNQHGYCMRAEGEQ